MQTENIEKRNQKMIGLFNQLSPTTTQNNKERNVKGFATGFGNLAGNNKMLQKSAKDFDTHEVLCLDTLNSNPPRMVHWGMDQYFTLNLFINHKHSKRKTSFLYWILGFYLDIDGMRLNGKKITDPEVAKEELYKEFERAGIKKPDLLVHTSTNPSVRTQCIWLIDPLPVRNEFGELREDRLNWWKHTNNAIALNLEQVESNLELDIDKSVVGDPVRYLRLPYSINQKTGETVKVLDNNISDKRHLLEDKWLNDLRQKYYKYINENKNCYYNTTKNYDILEHPQIKAIMQGVPKGYRNTAQYALMTIYESLGYSQDEILEKLYEFNDKCKPKDKKRDIRSVLRGYGKDRGLNIAIIADTANASYGSTEKDFKADVRLLSLYNIAKGGSKPKKKGKKNKKAYEVLEKLYPVIKDYIKYNQTMLPNLKTLSEMVKGITYNDLRNQFRTIKDFLKELDIYLLFNQSTNMFLIFRSVADFNTYMYGIMELTETDSINKAQRVIYEFRKCLFKLSNYNFINVIKAYNKGIHSYLYYQLLVNNYILYLERGSPKKQEKRVIKPDKKLSTVFKKAV
ncbi:MAG: hypothetical protein ACOCV1_03415 [Bacillota bacterium]